MKVINRYILSSFLTTFLSALLVLLVVMSLGAMFKLVDVIGRGAPWRPLGVMFLLNIPQMLSFSTPMAFMVATLLFFGRISADGEIMAMRSCGIGLWQIIAGPLVVAFLAGVGCLLIHNLAVPECHRASREILRSLRYTSVVSLLEEGRFVHSFPGMSLYIGQRRGMSLSQVRIYSEMGNKKTREIRAASGIIQEGTNGEASVIALTDVRIDPFMEDRPGAVYCEKWSVPLPEVSERSRYRIKPVNLTWDELRDRIRRPGRFFPLLQPGDLLNEVRRHAVELHKRLVLSIACPLFVLLGFPLGIQTHRRESSIGIAMSILLILCFHIFIAAAEAIGGPSVALPLIVVWAPVGMGAACSFWLMARKE